MSADESSPEPATVTVYTRENCHLCHEAIETIERVAAGVAREVSVETVDVDTDPALREEYGERVPYVLVDDRPAFKYRVDADELRATLSG
ncbi:glutaredoxin family protein [Haloplanus sp. C73]|uniref:glutaredoxin family protein n=1 Tax=Haloplanus sp. C73 TaxID=3421641 RepID=UPI003EBC6827